MASSRVGRSAHSTLDSAPGPGVRCNGIAAPPASPRTPDIAFEPAATTAAAGIPRVLPIALPSRSPHSAVSPDV